MFILGLTGSIGMGKTTASKIFTHLGIPVHDADATVHRLMKPDGAAFPALAARYPEAVTDDGMDRSILGKLAVKDTSVLNHLEEILHPLVRNTETAFLKQWARRRATLVVLDIPLLFETLGENRVDGIAVVSAPEFVQRQRVMARPGMTVEKMTMILSKQIPDRVKRRRADFIIHSGQGLARARSDILAIIRAIKCSPD